MASNEIKSRLKAELDKLPVTAHSNPAVAHCARAWLLHYFDLRLKGHSDAYARGVAGQSYRNSMPPLSGSRNVRNFIACTTHGMLINVLDRNEATKLLYAAQIAHTARRPRNKAKKAVQEPVSPDNEPFPTQPRNS